MGFSTPINEVIILVASVVLASSCSAYAIYAGTSLQGNIMQSIDVFKRNIYIRVEIGYATINETDSPDSFVIYVKNVGTLPITDISTIDVYVGEYGKASLYTYSADATARSGKFKLLDADGDGVWEPCETATIIAYPKSDVTASVYEVKIVPLRGIPCSYLFAAPS